MIITHDLARRLEITEALDGVDCAQACARIDAECGGAVIAVAGGFALFCGAASPLTHALAIGMHGEVSKADVLELEEFFRSRGAPVVIDITPYSDPSLRELLSGRGYAISDMSTVLVRALAADESLPEPPSGITLRLAGPEDEALYGHTVVSGFLSRQQLTEDELQLGRLLFYMPSADGVLAFAGPEVAGGCGLSCRNGVASFFGDATLPRFRGRGIHAAMIVDRIQRAAASGCTLATAGTQPGSDSQRHYQRLGFEVAYSKITVTKD